MKKPIRFKKRYLLFLPLLIVPFFTDSCMRMRMSHADAEAFFQQHEVEAFSRTIMLGDYGLHYIESGNPDGHTLLMLHGSPGAWEAYANYMIDPQLLQDFRLIAVDRPGFGYTNFGDSMNLDQQAELLLQVARSLDNGKGYTLMGHSYGGPLTVAMGIKAPELIQNLVVVAGSLDPAAEKPELWRKPLLVFPLKYYVPGSLRTSNEELWMLKEDLKELDAKLKDLSQTTYIIHGTADKLVPYSNVPFMEKKFSNARSMHTWTMQDKNHFILWDAQSAISDSLLVWLKQSEDPLIHSTLQ